MMPRMNPYDPNQRGPGTPPNYPSAHEPLPGQAQHPLPPPPTAGVPAPPFQGGAGFHGGPYGGPSQPTPPFGSGRSDPANPTPKRTWWGGYISLAVLLVSLLLWIATGVAAYSSESAGVSMSYVAVGPFAFGVGGLFVALLTRKNKDNKVASLLPIGCGCLSWIIALLTLFAFMVAIFPKL